MIKSQKFSEEFIAVKNPEFGDIVVAQLAGYPIHVGVYLGRNKMLHTLRGKDSCIESIDFKWAKRIEGYYRWLKFKQIH
jgi:cell wall-associated NlpC family hydrolase